MTILEKDCADFSCCNPIVHEGKTSRGDTIFYDKTCCEGSKCMAWRWVMDGWDDHPRRGYCGLAGKPEVK